MFGKSACDWLVVGLGNPGKQYDGSRHNCGFLAIDHLAKALDVTINRVKFRGLTAMAAYEGQKLCLLKPETFMNLSGIAVQQAASFYKIPPERVLVLFDDISLPVGRIRVRAEGSAAHRPPSGWRRSSPTCSTSSYAAPTVFSQRYPKWSALPAGKRGRS